MRRRESGILSLPKWITDEIEVADPEDADGSADNAAVELLLEIFEKLLFQNREPVGRNETTPAHKHAQ